MKNRRKNTMLKQYKYTVLSVLICLGMFVIVDIYYDLDHPVRQGSGAVSRSLGGSGLPAIGGEFKLTDQNGGLFTQENLNGKFNLIYFGYTFCPDVCPDGLSFMAAAYGKLPKDVQDNLRLIFITIDPERDTQEQMAEYVPNFHENMIGLRGSVDEVKKVLSLYKVYAAKRNNENAEQYLMDHSSYYYLMDPTGKYSTHFSDHHSISMDEFVAQLQRSVSK